jgi:hypothetical protein
MTDNSWLNDVNVAKDAEAIPHEEQLSRLANLAITMRQIEDSIATTEQKLVELKAEYRKVTEDQIPSLMDEIGISKITLSNGLKLSTKFFATGKVLNDDVYDWFEKEGFADIVKSELTVKTRRIEKQDLAPVKQAIREAGLEFGEKDSIHYQTMCSFLRERINEGGTLPPAEQLEVFRGFRATLK